MQKSRSGKDIKKGARFIGTSYLNSLARESLRANVNGENNNRRKGYGWPFRLIYDFQFQARITKKHHQN